MLSRVKLSPQAAAKVAQTAALNTTSPTERSHVRLRTRFWDNTSSISESKGLQYKSTLDDKTKEARTINAHIVHGSTTMIGLEQSHQFWVEKREYQVPRHRRRLMAVWDRLAHGLITLSRPQPRAKMLPEIAFRSMAMFLKILTIVQVAETRAILMPAQMTMNVEGIVGQAKDGKDDAAEKKPEGKSDEKKAAAEGGESPTTEEVKKE